MSRTTLHLAKENFKFSAAHFLIFDEKRAERLHGHNYRVRVSTPIPPTSQMEEKGFFIDFHILKQVIKSHLDLWDERVLLPQRHPDFRFQKKGPSLEVYFRDRYYVFPADEVVLLPVTNTSVEQLSRLLAEDLLKELRSYGLKKIRVSVEETLGQSASTLVGA